MLSDAAKSSATATTACSSPRATSKPW
jgi:hypothetical protein